jgi:hypothetical protein
MLDLSVDPPLWREKVWQLESRELATIRMFLIYSYFLDSAVGY